MTPSPRGGGFRGRAAGVAAVVADTVLFWLTPAVIVATQP